MKIYKAFFDTNFLDGEGTRTSIYLFDDDASTKYIETSVDLNAQEYFDDHEYLAVGYDPNMYDTPEDYDNDLESYHDSCYWNIEQITEEQKNELLEDEPDIDVIDLRRDR